MTFSVDPTCRARDLFIHHHYEVDLLDSFQMEQGTQHHHLKNFGLRNKQEVNHTTASCRAMPDDAASDAASQRAAEQARLRKERREAKIRAGGSARLNRITGLGGGIQRGMFKFRTIHLHSF